jgi:hypothetical protein
MSNTLSVRLATRKTSEGEVYEGTVSIEGAKPTKLVRKADGSTQFPSRSAVAGSARNFAKRYGYSDVNFVDPTATASKTPAAKTPAAKTPAAKAPAAKKAAKKSSVNRSVNATQTSPATTNQNDKTR